VDCADCPEKRSNHMVWTGISQLHFRVDWCSKVQ
jgi:hypothetical protein